MKPLLLAIMFHKRIVYMGIFGLLSVVIMGIVAKQLDYEIIVFNRMSEGSLVDGRAQLIDQSLTIFEQSASYIIKIYLSVRLYNQFLFVGSIILYLVKLNSSNRLEFLQKKQLVSYTN